MCDEIDQAQNLELLNIKIGIANRKPTMTFTRHCHFSECRQPITRGLFCDAGCRDDYEIDERRKGIAALVRLSTQQYVTTDGKPLSEHDKLITEILDRHAKKITALPPNTFPAKRWLSYYVRQIDKEIRGQL